MGTSVGVGSYRAESFAISFDDEIRRLNAQVDLFWRVESPLLERVGLIDGLDVLDCGCGPGRLIELLKTSRPALRCTGLEIDPVLAGAAAGRFAERNLADCRVVQGSAECPNLPEESFDFIVMRLVLEHLPDPVPALRQLAKLLRPGGRIAVISNDFEYHLRTWPPVDELDLLYEAYCASRRHDGGDPCSGRRLPSLLAAAGLSVMAFEMETAHSSLEGDRAFLQAEGSGIPARLVQTGFLSGRAFQASVGSWKRMLQTPDHVMMRPLFVGVGEKRRPGDSGGSPEDAAGAMAPQADDRKSRPAMDHVAPATDLEREIAAIWRRAIGVDRVGVTSNFFDIGGDSLVLEEIQTRIETCIGRELSTATLFQYPTVRGLAKHLAQSMAPDAPAEPDSGQDEISARAQLRRDAAARRRR